MLVLSAWSVCLIERMGVLMVGMGWWRERGELSFSTVTGMA